jgi:hypothetical protein
MKQESRSLVWGVLLIIIGLLFLGNNLDWFDFDWEDLWPSIMIIGGSLFWIGWLANRKEYGLLMPGTILLVYGLMFQYSAINGWYYMDELWPGFLLGPGLGFFFMYFLGPREKGLLIPAGILTLLSILFWSGRDVSRFFWPLLIIAVGVYLLIKARMRLKSADKMAEEVKENKEESKK